jgi:hypothetical protein
MDIFGLILPIKGEGWNLTPYAAFASIGAGSGFMEYLATQAAAGPAPVFHGSDSTTAWWGGFALNLNIWDPLTFALDVTYGRMGELEFDYTGTNTDYADLGIESVETSGWFIDAALDYKLDWGTVGIFGWFSTGDDLDDLEDGELGRMPSVSFDSGFAWDSFGGWGSNSIGQDGQFSFTYLGTWGIGVKLANVSFIEDLSHTLKAAYLRGTNDSDIIGAFGYFDLDPNKTLRISGEKVYMTDDDAAIEITLDTQYKLYENLSLYLELGYIHLDMDSAWKDVNPSREDANDAWKAQFLFKYSF